MIQRCDLHSIPDESTLTCGASNRREVAAEFAALLYGQAFAPLSKAMGFYGDTVVAATARTLARNERGGLVDRLERAIESASRADVARSVP